MEYVGTDLKYAFSSRGAFDFNTMEWDMMFFIKDKKVTMRKRNVGGGVWQLSCDKPNMGCKPIADGRWIFLLDSSFFGPGRIVAVLNAHIPDADFDPTSEFPTLDTKRNEVRRFLLESVDPL